MTVHGEMTKDESLKVIETARKVAIEFNQVGAKHDRSNTFPDELVPIFKQSGLAALNVPKRFGGLGADVWTTARCVQELAKGEPMMKLLRFFARNPAGRYRAPRTFRPAPSGMCNVISGNCL
jgi:alkylation response protein AidB-like acyl-CoA dehydrogenase